MKRDQFGRLNILTWFFALCFTSFLSSSFAQVSYESLNHQLYNFNQFPKAEFIDSTFSTSFRPNLNNAVSGENRMSYRNYIPVTEYDQSIFTNRKYKEYSWFRRKLLYENFIIIDTGILYITIDPLLNVSRGKSEWTSSPPNNAIEGNKSTYNNTRGLLVRADIGKKFSVETYFYENQSSFPHYIGDFVETSGVVPGQGRVKDFKKTDFDYAMSGGYFSYTPWEVFNVQFGHHKHFIGDGHRSLILSDNAFNYPFLQLNFKTKNKKVRYNILYAAFQDLDRIDSSGTSEGVFRKKGASYHLLEYQVNKDFRVYLAQGIIWPTERSDGHISFGAQMFNPLILTYPLGNGFDEKNNAILGFGFDLRLIKQMEIYSQAITDDKEMNRTAVQVGTRIFPTKTSFIQLEGNWVGQDVYATTSDEYFNAHVHYNEAAAHTLGNDFEEKILKAGYRYKRFIPEIQMNYITSRNNIKQIVLWTKLELAYLLNPATNLKIFTSYIYRESNLTDQEVLYTNRFINFGIKTDLRNIYYDF